MGLLPLHPTWPDFLDRHMGSSLRVFPHHQTPLPWSFEKASVGGGVTLKPGPGLFSFLRLPLPGECT